MDREHGQQVDGKANEISGLAQDRGAKGGTPPLPPATCGQILADGQRCRCRPLRGEQRCVNHSESEFAHESRKRGFENSLATRRLALPAKDKMVNDSRTLKEAMAEVMAGLAGGEFDTQRAYALTGAMKVMLEIHKYVDSGEYEDNEETDEKE